VSVKLPSDFAKKIGECLGATPLAIAELFEIEEDKQGFFIAKLKPKQFLDKAQFKSMCALIRDLGGEAYLQGAKAWKVPGPYAKKDAEKPSGQTMGRPATYKEPGNAAPASGVARSVTDDKSKPPYIPNLKFIPVDAIEVPNFLPTRELIQHEKVAQIRDSIKKRGLKYAIRVRHVPPDAYELIDGYLRLKAVRELNWKEIPAEIVVASDQDVVIDSIITNKDRIEEDPITIAKKLDILLNVFAFTQEKLAEEIGLSREYVANATRLLKLPKEIQQYIASNKIGFRHGLTLLTVNNVGLQLQLAKEAVEEGSTISELEERIDELQPKPIAPSPSGPARVAETPCGRCGDPIQGPPAHLDGEFYCQECYEQVQAEKVPGLLPERVEPEEEPTPPEPPAVDIGGFECPECHKHFIVEHLPNGKHKLKQLREETD
jgi:ParB/RepB/Spo0J family partition protein